MECNCCHKEKIVNLKHNLCIRCYTKKRRDGEIITSKRKTDAQKRKTVISNLINKYGRKIIDDLCDCKNKYNYDLVIIAEKYGFSRERSRQIYNIVHDEPYRVALENKKEITKHFAEEKRCILRKAADYKGLQLIGAKIEKMFLEECIKRGLNVQHSQCQSIDIIVNGYNVEIKSANSLAVTDGSKIGHYRYGFSGKHQRNKSDFVACYHNEYQGFFIIPKYAYPKCNIIYISAQWSSYKNSKHRYREFLNAWNLLEIKNNYKDAESA